METYEQKMDNALALALRDDNKDKVALLKQEAENGKAHAQANLAIYLLGRSQQEESVLWFQKAAAQENAKGMNGLAACLWSKIISSKSRKQDIEEAMRLVKKSAALGYEGAQKNLAAWEPLFKKYEQLSLGLRELKGREIPLWTAKTGEQKKYINPVWMEDGSLLIKPLTFTKMDSNESDGPARFHLTSMPQSIKEEYFWEALEVWEEYNNNEISLKDIRPKNKATYIVSIIYYLLNVEEGKEIPAGEPF